MKCRPFLITPSLLSVRFLCVFGLICFVRRAIVHHVEKRHVVLWSTLSLCYSVQLPRAMTMRFWPALLTSSFDSSFSIGIKENDVHPQGFCAGKKQSICSVTRDPDKAIFKSSLFFLRSFRLFIWPFSSVFRAFDYWWGTLMICLMRLLKQGYEIVTSYILGQKLCGFPTTSHVVRNEHLSPSLSALSLLC